MSHTLAPYNKIMVDNNSCIAFLTIDKNVLINKVGGTAFADVTAGSSIYSDQVNLNIIKKSKLKNGSFYFDMGTTAELAKSDTVISLDDQLPFRMRSIFKGGDFFNTTEFKQFNTDYFWLQGSMAEINILPKRGNALVSLLPVGGIGFATGRDLDTGISYFSKTNAGSIHFGFSDLKLIRCASSNAFFVSYVGYIVYNDFARGLFSNLFEKITLGSNVAAQYFTFIVKIVLDSNLNALDPEKSMVMFPVLGGLFRPIIPSIGDRTFNRRVLATYNKSDAYKYFPISTDGKKRDFKTDVLHESGKIVQASLQNNGWTASKVYLTKLGDSLQATATPAVTDFIVFNLKDIMTSSAEDIYINKIYLTSDSTHYYLGLDYINPTNYEQHFFRVFKFSKSINFSALISSSFTEVTTSIGFGNTAQSGIGNFILRYV